MHLLGMVSSLNTRESEESAPEPQIKWPTRAKLATQILPRFMAQWHNAAYSLRLEHRKLDALVCMHALVCPEDISQ